MLDSKRAKGTIKLGANSAVGTVMTHKQGKIYTLQQHSQAWCNFRRMLAP